MTEGLWIALIGSIQAVIVACVVTFGALVVKRMGAIRNDMAEVKTEVKNDHTVNMREEITTGTDKTHTLLGQILDTTGWLVGMALENRTDITQLTEQTGQTQTRRQRRLAAERPPIIQHQSIPRGTQ